MEPIKIKSYYPCVDAAIIEALHTPLRLALVGMLVIFFDFTFGESVDGIGWQIDFLHDSIGYACLFAACGRLNRAPAPASAKRWIYPMGIFAICGFLISFANCFTGWQLGPLGLIDDLFGLAGALAALAFVWTLREMCRAAMAQPLVTDWSRALIAVAVVWVAPLALAFVASVIQRASGGGPFHVSLYSPSPVCALLIVFLIPVVYLGIAYVRTNSWTPPGRLDLCHVCGYEVWQLPEPRCPECGTRFATERGSAAPGPSS